MKTLITVTIDHDQPIPDGITNAIEDRAYGWLHNKAGVRCSVSATVSTAVGTSSLDGKDAGSEGTRVAQGTRAFGLTAICRN